jgi:hypothetical protein
MRKLDKETAHQAYILAADNHLHPPALVHAVFTLLLMHTSTSSSSYATLAFLLITMP